MSEKDKTDASVEANKSINSCHFCGILVQKDQVTCTRCEEEYLKIPPVLEENRTLTHKEINEFFKSAVGPLFEHQCNVIGYKMPKMTSRSGWRQPCPSSDEQFRKAIYPYTIPYLGNR